MILSKSSIWDLHIHTNLCSSSKYGLETNKFIDELLKIFSGYEDLKMISFTDHNKINLEVYEEFYSREDDIVLIPGIEIDVKINNVRNSKHLIVYFEGGTNTIGNLSIIVNEIMEEYKVSATNPIELSKLLDKFISSKLNFTLNPHAFKQGKRGLDYDWTSEEFVNEPIKFCDQFFNFWETSGNSTIAKAEDYLRNMDLNETISIVSFSDSSDFKKLEEYLKNPTCYFNSLASFKGLQLVGSEYRRIYKEKQYIQEEEKSKLIGKIYIDNNEIELSNRLNTIIGGRGSGKSILVDKIGSYLREDLDFDKNRRAYLNKIHIELYDFLGNPIKKSFSFDYFNQNYVSKIFSSKNRSEELEKYFNKEFNKIKDINQSEIKFEIQSKFNEIYTKEQHEQPEGNVGDITKLFLIIVDDKIDMKLKKKDMKHKKFIDNFDYEKQLTSLQSPKVVPKEILNNDDVKDAIEQFRFRILKEIKKYNDEILTKDYIFDKLYENYFEYKSNLSERNKRKSDVEKLIQRDLNKTASSYINRINIASALIKLELEHNFFYEESDRKNNIKGFKFKKELKIEKPIDFFIRIFKKYISFTKKPENEICRDNIEELINIYCFDLEKFLVDSKTSNEMQKELSRLELIITLDNKIYYNGKDIENESPGTQTNILMEYIVKCDTSIPLIIDQPEDNVDNMTIYNSITKWFYELKSKRQIIVVTHDANITINADSENVIIAEQYENDKFKYTYGALEYGDNLLDASLILDGGKIAVKRRLGKYGE